MSIIFENFWTWAGTVILAVMLFDGVQETIRAAKGQERHVRVTTYGDRRRVVEISGATEQDVRRVMRDDPGAVCSEGYQDREGGDED